MPEIELLCGRDPDLTAMYLRVQLLSYLIYPANEKKRRGYISSWGGKARDMLVQTTQEQVNKDLEKIHGKAPEYISEEGWSAGRKELANEISEDWHDPFGGTGTIIQLPPEERLGRDIYNYGWDWIRVGVIFRLIFDFYHYYKFPVSIADVIPVYRKHKSFKDLRAEKHPSGESLNRDFFEDKTIYDLWKKYKRVAHLCAAYSRILAPDYSACLYWKSVGIKMWSEDHRYAATAHLAGDFGIGMKFAITYPNGRKYIGEPVSLRDFLICAKAYQAWGSNYIPKKKAAPLLPSNIWGIPDIIDARNIRFTDADIPPHSYRRIFETHRR
jgi:hypothetical protein